MENKELSLVEIQQEMLNTVIKIDEICKLLNIKYSLAYGSLIGAIRHKGFIPWDDDLDIWMTKRDLDIFCEYCNSHCDEIKPFKLCSRGNTLNYAYNIPRFANLSYKYVNTDKHQAMFDIGIFVDIYPIEGYGNSKKTIKKLARKSIELNYLYDIYINPTSRSGGIKTLIKKVIFRALHIIYKDKYYLIQEEKFDRYIKKYSEQNCKYVGCVRWAPQNPVLHKRVDIFDKNGDLNVVEWDFEGVKLKVLKNYDVILKNSYGDYMQLPPEDERHPIHEYKIYKRLDM